MSYAKKALTASAGAIMLAAALSGCTSGNNDSSASPGQTTGASPSAALNIDTSKHVTLQFYMLGDAPKDLDLIQSEVNKLAGAELNATVKFNFTTWTDWDQKYKLLLSSGQQVDLIFTADWTQYQAYASSGAFLALDDLLPKAAPGLQSFIPKDMWDAVKVKGKIYTVPSTYKEYVNNGFVYREDLRVKYNLPVPKDLETFEAYLEGIKKNESTMTPMGINGITDNLINPMRELSGDTIATTIPYGLGIKYKAPNNVYSYWGSDEQLADLQRVRRWAEKGLFAKNVLNQKEAPGDLIVSGKTAAIMGDNPTRYNETRAKMKSLHPDWELGYTPYAAARGFATPVHPVHNGFAIPKNSANPERALAFYEKLVTDKRYNQLTEYGIEGKHYTISNGYYKMVGDSTSNGFPREGMLGWAWRNPSYMLFDEGYDGVKQIFAELDKVAKPDLFTGFAEDYTGYQPERAAIEQVEKQYFYPLYAGLLEDIPGSLSIAMDKAMQAGLEKVQEAYKKQWLAYTAEQGIK